MSKFGDVFEFIDFSQLGIGAFAYRRGLRRIPGGTHLRTLGPIYYLEEDDLVACGTESVSGDAPDQFTQEVTSRVGTEVRDNLSKAFAASSFDVQQLDVVVTRRHDDGVLICDVTIEAIDNSA